MSMSKPSGKDLERLRAADQMSARPCSRFDPSKGLRLITYADSGDQCLYLPVNERVEWAVKYGQEHNVPVCIDEAAEIRFLDCPHMVVVRATVTIDGNLAGTGAAGIMLENNPYADRDAVQKAATRAKGRALANAGFGTFCSQADGGDLYPVDAGYVVDHGSVRIVNNNSPDARRFAPDGVRAACQPEEREPAGKAAPDPVPAPAARDSSAKGQTRPGSLAVPAQPIPRTLEEAQRTVCNISCAFKGKTMGEIYMLDRKSFDFWSSDRFRMAYKYPAEVAAAKIMLAAFEKSRPA